MRWDFQGDVTVVEARLRDALPLLALQRTVIAEQEYFITLPEELTVTLEGKERLLRELREVENSVMLVARLPNVQVAGCLAIVGGTLARMRHAAKIEIMVDPAHRGRGVGRALLTAGIVWAEENPLLVKLGLSVFATNERAIALYRSLGFEEEGRRPREYRMADGTFRDDLLLYRFVDGSHPEPRCAGGDQESVSRSWLHSASRR